MAQPRSISAFPLLFALASLVTGCGGQAPNPGGAGPLGLPPVGGLGAPAPQAPLPGPVSGGLPAPAGGTTIASGSTLGAAEIPGVGGGSQIGQVQFRVVGDPARVAHAVILCHGDAPAFYSNLLDEEGIDAKLRAAGVGALFAFPKSDSREWAGFAGGQNGQAIVALFDYMTRRTSPTVALHFGGLSGAGHVLNSFLSVVNSGGAEAIVPRLKNVTDHDALCRSIEPLKNNYEQLIRTRQTVRVNLIHGEKTGELNTNTTDQHQQVGRRIEPGFTLPRAVPQGVAIQGGRVRFWSGPDHFGCLRGQIFRSYFQ